MIMDSIDWNLVSNFTLLIVDVHNLEVQVWNVVIDLLKFQSCRNHQEADPPDLPDLSFLAYRPV